MSNTKRIAASKKAWRTRKRMKQARKEREPLVLGLTSLPSEVSPYEPHAHWPAYMKRALPPPDYYELD